MREGGNWGGREWGKEKEEEKKKEKERRREGEKGTIEESRDEADRDGPPIAL